MSTTAPRYTLAVDTSTHTQVIALLDRDQVLTHIQARVKLNHGSSLLEELDRLLAERGLKIRDIDLFVIGLGPGSFTGLRVGLAALKGLARACDTPIVGVSTLQTIAHDAARSAPGRPVCVAVDARKKEVYAGFYVASEDGVVERSGDEEAMSPEVLAERLGALVTPDNPATLLSLQATKYAPLRELALPGLAHLSDPTTSIDGVALATLGRARFLEHGADELSKLEPHYVRPSDAEISLARRQQNT